MNIFINIETQNHTFSSKVPYWIPSLIPPEVDMYDILFCGEFDPRRRICS